MKLVKKWLFPMLTCLIVAGAAVLPARVSQARDARQFWPEHIEPLAADALPVYEAPTLLDRMALYAGQYSSSHPVLSFRDNTRFEDSESKDLGRSARELLTGAGVLPKWIFEDEPFDEAEAALLLLWDPEQSGAFQDPSTFREISWRYESNKSHQKSVRVVLDAETGLPIHLYVHDTNMSQWLPYDTGHLRTLAEHFFDLLGLEVRETDVDGPRYVPSLNLSYSIVGSEMTFFVSRAPTDLSIQLDLNWRSRAEDGTIRSPYDG